MLKVEEVPAEMRGCRIIQLINNADVRLVWIGRTSCQNSDEDNKARPSRQHLVFARHLSSELFTLFANGFLQLQRYVYTAKNQIYKRQNFLISRYRRLIWQEVFEAQQYN